MKLKWCFTWLMLDEGCFLEVKLLLSGCQLFILIMLLLLYKFPSKHVKKNTLLFPGCINECLYV